MTENWLIFSLVSLYALVELVKLAVRHSTARRRDQAKAGGQPV